MRSDNRRSSSKVKQAQNAEAQKRSEEVLGSAAVHTAPNLAKEIQRSILLSMTFVPQNRQQSNQRSSRAAVFVCVCRML
jgi:hypothetical protein